jgi:hypothetical protein
VKGASHFALPIVALEKRIISNLIEKENGFISERVLFSGGSANRGRSLKQVGPLPGQESIRLAKKAVVPLFPMRASAVSARRTLGHRVSLRRQRGGNRGDFSRPFLASAPAFLPGQQGNGSERPTNLEMIHLNKSELNHCKKKGCPLQCFEN